VFLPMRWPRQKMPGQESAWRREQRKLNSLVTSRRTELAEVAISVTRGTEPAAAISPL
jgi:hypothetical protein